MSHLSENIMKRRYENNVFSDAVCVVCSVVCSLHDTFVLCYHVCCPVDVVNDDDDDDDNGARAWRLIYQTRKRVRRCSLYDRNVLLLFIYCLFLIFLLYF